MKSFYSYLKSRSKEGSAVGDFARDTIRSAQQYPNIRKYGPIGLWLFIKQKYPVCSGAFDALCEASKEYGYGEFLIKFHEIEVCIGDWLLPIRSQLAEDFFNQSPSCIEDDACLVYDAYWIEKCTDDEFVHAFDRFKVKMTKGGF